MFLYHFLIFFFTCFHRFSPLSFLSHNFLNIFFDSPVSFIVFEDFFGYIFVFLILFDMFSFFGDLFLIIPQQRKLMGSSAQNSSGVHWCRRRVRFNEVPEKVPKVPGKVWEVLVQSQVTFNRVPEKVLEKVPEKVRKPWCKAKSGSTGFRRRFRRRFRWLGRLWCRTRSGSTGRRFRRRFRRRSGGFHAEPGQVQQGSGEGSKVLEALVQSQVRFNRVPEKVP